MKSKVQFDLNGQDESVIKATIIQTDDIRDKVAKRFHEALGYASNLAVVRIHPDTKVFGLELREGREIDVEVYGRVLEIKSYGGDEIQTDLLCKEICSEQLEALIISAKKELDYRNVSCVVGQNTI